MTARNLNLSNTFWSEDYITGIDWFIHRIELDISELKRLADVYDTFHTSWSYSTKQLASVVDTLSAGTKSPSVSQNYKDSVRDAASVVYQNHLKLIGQLADKFKSCTLVQAEDPVKNVLFKYEEFYKDIKSSLKQDYNNWTKQQDVVKRVYSQIKKKANIAVAANEDTKANNSGIVTEKNADKRYPVVIGSSFVVANQNEWCEFVADLQKEVPLSKRPWPIPGLPSEYFSTDALYQTLKQLCPKLDSSLYNLEQVGQYLMDNNVLRGYNDVLHRPGSRFAGQGFYCWVVHDATQRPASANILQGIWRRVSSNSSEEDSSLKALELSQLNEQFIKNWIQCETEKLKLETAFYKSVKKYAHLCKEKLQTVKEADHKMIESFRQNWAIENPPYELDVEEELNDVFAKNHGTVGFYTPRPALQFEMYDIYGTLASQPWLFGTNLNKYPHEGDEIPIVLSKLLAKASSFEPEEIAKQWLSPLDSITVYNMKRDCLNEYLNSSEHASVMEKLLLKWQSPANIIHFLRAWLLELPDSLVPMLHYRKIKQGDQEWLPLCPPMNARCLGTIAEHFQLLDEKQLITLLIDPPAQDFPVSHHFIRSRVREPTDCLVFNNVLFHCFKDPNFPQKCRSLALPPVSPRPDRKSHSIITISDSQEFVPKPFKTSSSESSPTRSKPKNGLYILQSPSEHNSD
ncbi:HCL297Wp [Eremothecium sinecaudum]|uniref:HCL297Wp n=1 Tax=Eremothecium sinecaudum TaxID=45286 RepID=A0A109UYG6_9SACH|nr:HCL297Wp [Eremothecium sinecaudum]AMD19854.1 HCL297Wp [Eremothecium sinecaudum]